MSVRLCRYCRRPIAAIPTTRANTVQEHCPSPTCTWCKACVARRYAWLKLQERAANDLKQQRRDEQP